MRAGGLTYEDNALNLRPQFQHEAERQAARPMRAALPYLPRRRFSALTRRILSFNVIAFLVLIGGVLWVQSSRIGLVEERIAGIRDIPASRHSHDPTAHAGGFCSR